MDNAQMLTEVFEDTEIRVVGENPRMVVLSDLAKAMGYSLASNISRYISDDRKGTHSVNTPGGTQKMACTTKKGLIESMWHISPRDPEKKKAVERFREWALDVLVEVLENGEYREENHSNTQDQIQKTNEIIRQNQQMQTQMQTQMQENSNVLMRVVDELFGTQEEVGRVESEMKKRTSYLKDKQDDVDSRVHDLEETRKEGRQMMMRLDPPEVEAPEKSDSARLNEIVRAYATSTGSHYGDAWNSLYRQINYRLGLNVQSRATRRNCSKIDVLKQDGLLKVAYSVACKVFSHALGDRFPDLYDREYQEAVDNG